MTRLPDSAFWRFSVRFYAGPGVADACLALQDRAGADVNLILLALWLGARGHELDPATGLRLTRLARDWQRQIVAPLRRVRRRLKERRDLPWPEPVAVWRRRLGDVELAMEQVEQLLLEKAVGAVGGRGADQTTARSNLAVLGLAEIVETAEAAMLLQAATDPSQSAT